MKRSVKFTVIAALSAVCLAAGNLHAEEAQVIDMKPIKFQMKFAEPTVFTIGHFCAHAGPTVSRTAATRALM